MSFAASTARWPTMSDYQEAVQSPSLCFADPELQRGTAVVNKLGLPRPICGQFASVYEVETSRHFAVKCFLRNIPDQHERYAKISEHLGTQNTDYFVTFEYQQDGIKIHGKHYPLVKMEWVEASALNHFIEQNLRRPKVLRKLEQRWLALLEDLRSIGVGHGDLQHGNVLVLPDGSLRLIDYDGMWVPSLAGQTSHETGHPNYQNPRRTATDFDADIDRFAGAVIRIAIRSLSLDPDLWKKYDNGDNLLFRRQDFLQPSKSELIADLRALADPEIENDPVITLGRKQGSKAVAKARKTASKQKGPKRPKAPKTSKQQPQRARQKPRKKQKQHTKKNRGRRNKQEANVPVEARQRAAPGKLPSRPAPSWLEDHLPAAPQPSAVAKPVTKARSRSSATRSASAPSKGASAPAGPPQRRSARFRAAVHALIVTPLLFPSVGRSISVPADADPMASLPQLFLSVPAVLGCLSLATLYVFRKAHRVTSLWFFGYMIPLLALNMVSIALNDEGPSSKQEALLQYGLSALLLLASLWAVIFRRK